VKNLGSFAFILFKDIQIRKDRRMSSWKKASKTGQKFHKERGQVKKKSSI